jgi:hypothetical protein
MRRRKLWWVLAGLAPLFLVAGVFVLWPDEDWPEKCSRIAPKMSRTEVEAIMGGPADTAQPVERGHAKMVYVWRDSVGVYFDETERVTVSAVYRPAPPPEDLARRLNRLWRRWFPEQPAK